MLLCKSCKFACDELPKCKARAKVKNSKMFKLVDANLFTLTSAISSTCNFCISLNNLANHQYKTKGLKN